MNSHIQGTIGAFVLVAFSWVPSAHAAVPASLAFISAPQSIAVGHCGAATIGLLDASSNPVNAVSNTVVHLAGTGGVSFYSSSTCATAESSVEIFGGSKTNSSVIFFQSKSTGLATLAVSAGGLATATQTEGIGVAAPPSPTPTPGPAPTPPTQPITYASDAPAGVAFFSAPQSIAVSQCSGTTTVGLQDASYNPVKAVGNTTVSLKDSTGKVTFYSDSTCATKITTRQINGGSSSVPAVFYFKAATAGLYTLAASASQLTTGTQIEGIGKPAPVQTTGRPPAPQRTPTPGVFNNYNKGMNAEGPNELPYQTPTQLGTTIANMQTMGVSWVRMIFAQSEMSNDCTSNLGFSAMDGAVNALNAAGINTLAIIGTTASCANGGAGAGWIPPTDTASYIANFVTPVVQHYAAMGVHSWEVWNEPNGAWDWPPAVNAAAYTKLLCGSYSAIHAIQPGATVISAGGPDQQFLTNMYAAGAHGCMDALDSHPYPGTTTLRGGNDVWGSMYISTATTPSMLSVMTANGDGAKKIWVTEIGCVTGGTSEPWFLCTPTQQAQMVTDAYHYSVNGFPNLGPVFWFNYGDFPTTVSFCAAGTTVGDCFWGLYDSDGYPKQLAVTSYINASGVW